MKSYQLTLLALYWTIIMYLSGIFFNSSFLPEYWTEGSKAIIVIFHAIGWAIIIICHLFNWFVENDKKEC